MTKIDTSPPKTTAAQDTLAAVSAYAKEGYDSFTNGTQSQKQTWLDGLSKDTNGVSFKVTQGDPNAVGPPNPDGSPVGGSGDTITATLSKAYLKQAGAFDEQGNLKENFLGLAGLKVLDNGDYEIEATNITPENLEGTLMKIMNSAGHINAKTRMGALSAMRGSQGGGGNNGGGGVDPSNPLGI